MKRSDYLFLSLILFVGFIWRYLHLEATNSVIDGDEAIVGIMALDILKGSPWPIFYYGQNYMGSFESILTAGVFSILGPSCFALKIVPLLFSLYLIVAIYLLTKEVSSTWAARVAVVLAAVPPSALTVWSTKARGGFIEIVALGTIAILLGYLILTNEKNRLRNMALLGFTIGIGWWINNQMIYYALSIALVYLIFAPFLLGLWQSIKLSAIGAATFVIGSAPFWYANLFLEPRFATFTELLGRHTPEGTGFSDHFVGFIQNSLPILVGAAQFWSSTETFAGAKPLFAVLYLLVFVFFIASAFSKDSAGQIAKKKILTAVLFLSFFTTVAIVFSASSFGWLSQAPRYLLSLYSVLFPAVAISLYYLKERSVAGKVASYSALVVLLFAQGFSNFHQGGWYQPGQPVIYENDRVAVDHTELYRWLSEHKCSHIYTNYWIGYRVAFETREQVTFTRFGEPRDLRIPRYEEDHKEQKLADRVYVAGPKEAALLEGQLTGEGYRFNKDFASGYALISQIEPVVPRVRSHQIKLTTEMIHATHKAEFIPFLIDHDLSTRWGSAHPQTPGMMVEVAFDKARMISEIEIDYGNFPQDMPRGLVVSGLREDGAWQELFRLKDGGVLDHQIKQPDGKLSNQTQLYLQPTPFIKIRLEQTRTHPVFDWSIAELKLFEQEKY